MASVLLLPDEQSFVGPTQPGVAEPLIAFDPITGEREVILDEVMWSTLPEGALQAELPIDEPVDPRPPDRSFRAVVVPRRIRGLGTRPPLMPGARARYCCKTLRPPYAWVPGGIAPHPTRRELFLTEFPVTVTSTGPQALEHAREVLDVDELTIELQVLSLTGATPSITVELQTGMQLDSTSGWVSAGAFTSVTSAPFARIQPFTKFLRYICWNVSAFTGTAATFFVSGMERRWSKAS